MRRLWVFIHRWTGLVMAGFLIIVALTGSLLAFYNELEHLVAPQLFATPRLGIAPLDVATLAERAEALVPEARVTGVWLWYPDQVLVSVGGRIDPETNQPHELAYDQLLLDPWTGNELGRRAWGDISQGSISLMSFIYTLHYALALGMPGIWVLGFVALAWTIDCFVGFYLTLPIGIHKFWKRWKPAWQIKAGAGVFRLNFDLHRAAGLWLWGVLLVFAWSSVYMNLWDTVYTWATRAVFEYHAPWTELVDRPQPLKTPRLDWREAQTVGERLMAEAAASHGFSVENPIALSFDSKKGLYRYGVRSSKDIQDHRGKTDLYFDGETGAMTLLLLPTGQFAGNTVTSWLYALHTGNVFGLPWRIFVCGLGLVVVLLSVTGVYIWWKKRSARKLARSRKGLPTEIDDAETAAYGRSKPA